MDDEQKDLSQKRLSESAPHELEMAFKQALKDSGKIQPISEETIAEEAISNEAIDQESKSQESKSQNSVSPESISPESTNQDSLNQQSVAKAGDSQATKPEANLWQEKADQSRSGIEEAAQELKSGTPTGDGDKNYENSFNLFADIFYGVLVAPKQTMLVLGDSKRFAPSAGHIAQAGFLAVLALSTTGWLRFKLNHAPETAAGSLFFVLWGLGDWLVISLILFYLSIFMRGHRLTPGNALITVGWCFLPFFFFAPVACFKGLFGQSFLYFATIPAFWFLYLLWTAFQAALRTSTAKLALLLIAVPPLVVFVYLFWISLSAVLLLVQLSKCLSP
jgi:hypothetical protein